MRFRLEYVNASKRYVFAASLGRPDFHLTDTSTLGGKPVKMQLTQPRSSEMEGKSRLDLFAFYLLAPVDDWEVGMQVELRGTAERVV